MRTGETIKVLLILFCLVLISWFAGGLSEAAEAGAATWQKLADPPADLAGRESVPGMDGAWVYVPEWRGYLLYGGRSPSHSNQGWFFDPDKREWTPLWADDQLGFEKAKGKWRGLLPREITWSLDRPGPAMGHAAVYLPQRKQVLLAGGHPSSGKKGDATFIRSDFYGATKLGTWGLNPATGKFEDLGEEGPRGLTYAACDGATGRVVTAPQGGTTWVYTAASGKWEALKTAGAPENGVITYDSAAAKFLVYDGSTIWAFESAANAWKKLESSVNPPPRRHAGLCFDAARGVTMMHGGVISPHGGHADFEAQLGGKCINDTWAFNAARNEWTELKSASVPQSTLSSRSLFTYDCDRQQCVLYDVGIGVWALGTGAKKAPERTAALPEMVKREPPKAPVTDEKTAAWQQQVKGVADDSWADFGVPHPVLGCMGTLYDPSIHCIVQLGGCGGALFSSYGDYGYHNQTWLFDMDVGRFVLRRAHHSWGPETADFITRRLPAGCTRAACFDSKRSAIWCRGGNGQPLLKCPRAIRSYDANTDVFSAAGERNPTGDGEADYMVYDSKHDLVLATRARSCKISLYNPTANIWTDGGPCPITMADDLSTYTGKAFDPEVGLIMVCASPKGWQVGEPKPAKPEWVMRTFAYDASAKKWRDLAPAGGEKLPLCTIPGIAYDSRNRAVLFVKSDHGDIKNYDPAVPYGTSFVLDLASNTWKPVKAGPPNKLNLGGVAYDANHNLFICMLGFQGNMVFYRYKGGCPSDAFGGK